MFKRKLRQAAGVVLAATMAVSTVGCSGSSSTDTTAASEAASEAASGAESSGESTEASEENSESASGGSVTICYPDILTTCFLPFSSSTGDRFSVAPAIESLGRTDIEGNVSGWLADSFTVDQENLTVTIKLKEGIQFRDGSDFNADAVN